MLVQADNGGHCIQPSGTKPLLENDRWALGLGVLLILLGFGAMALPVTPAFKVETMLGWIFATSGLAQCAAAFSSPQWPGFFWALLHGVLHLVVGTLLLAYPRGDTLSVTLLLGSCFVLGGAFGIVLASHMRPAPRWVWPLMSGTATLFLAVPMWTQWPSAEAWVIGAVVGIHFMLGGGSTLMLVPARSHSGSRP